MSYLAEIDFNELLEDKEIDIDEFIKVNRMSDKHLYVFGQTFSNSTRTNKDE